MSFHHTISALALDIMYWSFGVLAIVVIWLVPPRLTAAPWRRTSP